MVTLFWQYRIYEFPAGVILNLFFNGDKLNAGISAIVPFTRGLTQLRPNTAPTTLSLYLRDVSNQAGLSFDDGTTHAQLGAAFYVPSAPALNLLDPIWRPSDFINIDRVGFNEFRPDGRPDGVLIFELTVGPSQNHVPATSGQGPVSPVGPAASLRAIVGDDLLVPPAKTLLSDQNLPSTPAATGADSGSSGASPSVVPAATSATPGAMRTPTPVSSLGARPTGTPERVGTHMSATPTPGRAMPTVAAPSVDPSATPARPA